MTSDVRHDQIDKPEDRPESDGDHRRPYPGHQNRQPQGVRSQHPRIIIEAISQGQQRYDTLGDWFFDKSNGDLTIRVTGADVLDQDEVFLIAFHELIEAKLCLKHGVTQGAVDAFDMAFKGEGEPGDDPAAPYQREHRAAMILEHAMALFLDKWDYGKVE